MTGLYGHNLIGSRGEVVAWDGINNRSLMTSDRESQKLNLSQLLSLSLSPVVVVIYPEKVGYLRPITD